MRTTSLVCLILGILLVAFGVTAVISGQVYASSGYHVYRSLDWPMSVQVSMSGRGAASIQNLQMTIVGTGAFMSGMIALFMSLYAHNEHRRAETFKLRHGGQCHHDAPQRMPEKPIRVASAQENAGEDSLSQS